METLNIEDLKPWEKLEELIEQEDLIQLTEFIVSLSTDDRIIAVTHLDEDDQVKLLTMLEPKEAADLIDGIPNIQVAAILEELSSASAAAILSELRSDEQADLLSEIDDHEMEGIFTEMDEDDASSIRRLIEYEPDTAGGLMITEFLAFDEDEKVDIVASTLRDNVEKYEKYNVQYIYVTAKGKFVGVLQMRDLVLSRPNTPLSKIVLRKALTVYDTLNFDELIDFFDDHDFYGVPVVNHQEELVGVVLRKRVREMEAELSHREHLETQGIVGGEELRSMPVWLRSKRRLSWLSVNILLNIIAASVIALYSETLQSVIALAVFLPVISDMSGCSGNQAVAVSLRELALGVVRPYEVFRVWVQEVSVGLINGVVLGFLIGATAWIWQGNVYLGLVVGAALAINTVVAVSLGGIIPLVLKKWKVDPALASGPILTTVTDMMGFFLALSFAGAMLKYLV